MDTQTLAWSLVLVLLGISFLGGLMAFHRKDHAVTVWSAGIAASALGFGLVISRSTLPSWVSVFIGGGMVASFAVALPWGLRYFLGLSPAWPRRFTFFVVLELLALAAATLVWPSYPARGSSLAIVNILFTVEAAILCWRTKTFSRGLRTTLLIIAGAFIVFHGLRGGFILLSEATDFLHDSGFVQVSIWGTVSFASLWAGILIVLDADRVHRQTQAQAAELLRLNALKDRVLAMTSHDLRGPLGNLHVLWRELSEHMMNGQCTDADQELLRIVDRSLVGTQSLLENLFSFAEAQQAPPVGGVETDLTLAVETVLTQWGPPATAKGVVLKVEPSETVRVPVPFPSVVTVLRNLVGNSVKFTPSGGSVVLRILSSGEGEPCVEVSDTGIGMTREQWERSHRMESRTSRPGTDGERGSGFGLVLVRELVGNWNGSVDFQSEPGQGTLVRVRFPS